MWSALLAALLQLLHAKEKLLHSVPLRLIEARQVVGKERLFQSAQTCKLGRREGVGAVFVEQGTKERLLSFLEWRDRADRRHGVAKLRPGEGGGADQSGLQLTRLLLLFLW